LCSALKAFCPLRPQIIAIAMDVFTDVDIFREVITATLRGVVVYILLDDSQFQSFLTMSQRVGVNIQDLKVRGGVSARELPTMQSAVSLKIQHLHSL